MTDLQVVVRMSMAQHAAIADAAEAADVPIEEYMLRCALRDDAAALGEIEPVEDEDEDAAAPRETMAQFFDAVLASKTAPSVPHRRLKLGFLDDLIRADRPKDAGTSDTE